MCGITGFLDVDGRLSETDLRRMNATLTRRGPDGEGYFSAPGIGLAMRRLAIIDLEGGWQPVYNEDKTIAVVFNGEIYNYQQLRARLIEQGHRFRTHSDSEVIAHLYEEHGEAFVERLEGMFAIALWDSVKKRLVIARDRLGIKPLFVARIGRSLVFGSEIKSVLASGIVPKAVDWSAVDQYFAYTYIPAPRSIYRDVSKFPAGHIASMTLDGNIEIRPYWKISGTPLDEPMAELERRTELALLQAVESHMVSDVPVGAFLSGGIDSSLIVAMMTRFTDKPVQTFTVGFRHGGPLMDERAYARELASRYGLQHSEIEVQPDAASILPELMAAFDEPFADDSMFPSYYVSQATARSVKVAMTGLGGDELFAGYKRHLGVAVAGHYSAVPAPVRHGIIDPVLRAIPEGWLPGDMTDHLKRFSRAASDAPEDQYQDYLSSQRWDERSRLYVDRTRAHFDPETTADVVRHPYRVSGGASRLEQALRTDLAVYLPDDILALTDRVSMWHSLELRVPFLHHPLVELAASLPAKAKIHGMTQKYILRRIAKRWIPESILKHRKQGFEAPMGHWLKGPLLPMLDEAISPASLEPLGIFDHRRVRLLRDEHVNGIRKNSKVLFSLLVFAEWARRNSIRFDT